VCDRTSACVFDFDILRLLGLHMKRIILIAAALGSALATGCVSSAAYNAEGVDFVRDHRRYEPRAPWKPQPPRRDAGAKRQSRATRPEPARFTKTWYPQGRRISSRWTRIVIHHSATTTGGARVFDKYHRKVNGWDELGYHFVIGNGRGTVDGMIEVGSRWHKQKHGAHCKTPDNYFNNHGIGICLVGDFTERPPSAAQMAALEQLVRFLSRECHIPPGMVTSHGAVTGKTACPGNLFPLRRFQRSLRSPVMAGSFR